MRKYAPSVEVAFEKNSLAISGARWPRQAVTQHGVAIRAIYGRLPEIKQFVSRCANGGLIHILPVTWIVSPTGSYAIRAHAP